MRKASIAVVMPVFNGASTLERSLASLAADITDAVEIVAVVQASDDGSRAILERAATHLPLRILDAEKDSNWMRNTNIGIQSAAAPFVTMLHQDDLWCPGRLATLTDLTARFPNAALWLHPAWFIDDNDRRVGVFGPPFGTKTRLVRSDEALENLLVQNSVALPAALFPRALYLETGGLSEELWYTADWDLWLRLAGRGPIGWSPQTLSSFRIHANSQTIRGSRNLEDFQSQLEVPLTRHLGVLSASNAAEIEAMARTSVELNLFLAGRFHRKRVSPFPFLRGFARLGPLRWSRFLRRTQILRRLLPRVALMMQPQRSSS